MKYIINRSVVFEPHLGILSIQNDVLERSFTLLPPACRLLNELIKFQGKPVTREYLLKHVWEDYGFSASDANLNNNISTLRRGLETLEQPRSIILTIPKVGFQLSADLECLIVNGDALVRQDNAEIPSLQDVHIFIAPPKKEEVNEQGNGIAASFFLKQKDTWKVGGGVFFLFFLFFLFFTFNEKKIIPYEINPELIYKEGNCNVYTLDKKNVDYKINLKSVVIGYLKKESVDCSGKKVDIFFEMNSGKERSKVYLLTTCIVNENGTYSNCENTRNITGVM